MVDPVADLPAIPGGAGTAGAGAGPAALDPIVVFGGAAVFGGAIYFLTNNTAKSVSGP